MLQMIWDTIFSTGTLFGLFFIFLGIIVILKTIEKILIFLYQLKNIKKKYKI